MRPRIVAHRGASAYRAEMTLAAFELAIAMGADAIECDVRMTADGHLVCWHDSTVNRTSNGTGAVARMTLAQLRELDCASWFVPTHEPVDGVPGASPSTHIVTLRELLAFLREQPQRVDLLLETKHPSAFAGAVERQVIRDLHVCGWDAPRSRAESRVAVMSFSAAALVRVRAVAPALPVVYLTKAPLKGRLPSVIRNDEMAALGPSIVAIRQEPDTVREILAGGREVLAWTVDEENDINLCHQIGVSAMISNRPDFATAVLGDDPEIRPRG